MDIKSYLLGLAHGKKSGGDTIGIWYFNDELNLFEGKNVELNFNFYPLDCYDESIIIKKMNQLYISIDGIVAYYIYIDGNLEGGFEDVYENGYWNNRFCKFIIIFEEPPTEVAEWIRANATKLS